MEILREWNKPCRIYFPLVTAGSGDFNSVPPTFVVGDVKYSQNGAAFVNATGLPVHVGGGSFYLDHIAVEMRASSVVVKLQDTAPKVWEDQEVIIATYGSISGMFTTNFKNLATDISNEIGTTYFADINFNIDNTNSKDEYTVSWFKNGNPLSSGEISSPTLQVVKRADGTDLIISSGMSYISSSLGVLKKDETSNRVSLGEAYIAQVTATIDSATRTWRKLFSRDN